MEKVLKPFGDYVELLVMQKRENKLQLEEAHPQQLNEVLKSMIDSIGRVQEGAYIGLDYYLP